MNCAVGVGGDAESVFVEQGSDAVSKTGAHTEHLLLGLQLKGWLWQCHRGLPFHRVSFFLEGHTHTETQSALADIVIEL